MIDGVSEIRLMVASESNERLAHQLMMPKQSGPSDTMCLRRGLRDIGQNTYTQCRRGKMERKPLEHAITNKAALD